MTQNEKDRLQYMIDVMTAFKDGKEIESSYLGNEIRTWSGIMSPRFNWGEFDYRIKPELPKPQYRPFENAEEVLEAIKEHGDIVIGKCSTVYRKITAFDPYDVNFGADKFIGYKDAYTAYTFADGTPFGVLENAE